MTKHTLIIKNESNEDIKDVVIGGAKHNLSASCSNYGNNLAISVSVEEQDKPYGQWLFETLDKPKKINKTVLQSENTSQILETIYIKSKNSRGGDIDIYLTPVITPYHNTKNEITATNDYIIDGEEIIKISTVYANTTLKVNLS